MYKVNHVAYDEIFLIIPMTTRDCDPSYGTRFVIVVVFINQIIEPLFLYASWS